MSWNACAGLFGELIYVTMKSVPDDDSRREIYEHMIDSFIENDWDAFDECKGVDPIYDEIIDERFPSEELEEEDEEPEDEY